MQLSYKDQYDLNHLKLPHPQDSPLFRKGFIILRLLHSVDKSPNLKCAWKESLVIMTGCSDLNVRAFSPAMRIVGEYYKNNFANESRHHCEKCHQENSNDEVMSACVIDGKVMGKIYIYLSIFEN